MIRRQAQASEPRAPIPARRMLAGSGAELTFGNSRISCGVNGFVKRAPSEATDGGTPAPAAKANGSLTRNMSGMVASLRPMVRPEFTDLPELHLFTTAVTAQSPRTRPPIPPGPAGVNT